MIFAHSPAPCCASARPYRVAGLRDKSSRVISAAEELLLRRKISPPGGGVLGAKATDRLCRVWEAAPGPIRSSGRLRRRGGGRAFAWRRLSPGNQQTLADDHQQHFPAIAR
jgi:hypothetical protein